MKVAYLILAHQNPPQVARLIRTLSSEWAYFFLHIDRKTGLAPFTAVLPAGNHVHYLDGNDRVSVYWGGFSQVRATLNLLQTARNAGIGFHRYCLLSGADFPIKSNAALREAQGSEQEFMGVEQQLLAPQTAFHSEYVKRYYFYDHYLLNPRTAPVKRLSTLVDTVARQIPRRQYGTIPLYHGSQWWSLTRPCVEYIFEFLRQHPDYLRFHRYSLVPDEIFFHSIVKSSPFAAYLTHDFERASSPETCLPSHDHGSHYIDWQADGASPKVLDLSDWDALLQSRALFARKFEEPRSAALLTELEKLRLA